MAKRIVKPPISWIAPCEPTIVEKPPSGPEWIHEIKWDGYRISVYVDAGQVTIRSRRGYDWTARFPTIAAVVAETMKAQSAIIDGEAVILDAEGKSSFAELQAALGGGAAHSAVLYAFDLLFLNGEDLRPKPLDERRTTLRKLIKPEPPILLSDEFSGDGGQFYLTACEHKLEGIVSKRLDRPYRSGKSRDWLKTKCVQSGVFAVSGYQPGAPLANLKVARLDSARLHYAGAVGTGFSDAVGRTLLERLKPLATPRSIVPGLRVKGAVWTKPEMIVQVAYRGLTADGELRHASFKGIVE